MRWSRYDGIFISQLPHIAFVKMCAPPYQDFFMVVREVVLVVTGVLGVYFTLPFNFS
jgi:hypothetical protein